MGVAAVPVVFTSEHRVSEGNCNLVSPQRVSSYPVDFTIPGIYSKWSGIRYGPGTKLPYVLMSSQPSPESQIGLVTSWHGVTAQPCELMAQLGVTVKCWNIIALFNIPAGSCELMPR